MGDNQGRLCAPRPWVRGHDRNWGGQNAPSNKKFEQILIHAVSHTLTRRGTVKRRGTERNHALLAPVGMVIVVGADIRYHLSVRDIYQHASACMCPHL
jgi:hypothetical protein